MAKMYYNVEEAAARLGCNEEQLRGMVRAGKLREFRDAGKLNYRVDEVDKLVAAVGDNISPNAEDSGELSLASDSGDQPAISKTGSGSGLDLDSGDAPIDLGGSDSGAAIQTGGSSGSGIVLSDSDTGAPPAKKPPAKPGAPVAPAKTGSGSGMDALRLDEADREIGAGVRKDDTVITNIGISVFDDDDLEIAADPRAKTMMTGAEEHLGLDGSGGGSGLLDLTRESDDTSLGAELLEGIDMGDTAETISPAGATAATEEIPAVEEAMPETAMAPTMSAGPMVMLAPMEPISPLFTGMLAAAALVLALLGATAVAMAMAASPSYLATLSANFWITLAGGIVLGGIGALIGHFMGRPSIPRAPKAPKAAKEKKAKPEKSKKK